MGVLKYAGLAAILLQAIFLSQGDEDAGDLAGSVPFANATLVNDQYDALEYLAGRMWIDSTGTASELIDIGQLLRDFQNYAGLVETGIFDLATKMKMNSPRCGNPDFGPKGFQRSIGRRKRFTTLGTSWPQNEITWYLEGMTSDLTSTVVRQELAMAFQYWEDVSALSFREVFSDEADIIIGFFTLDHNDRNPFDGPGNVLAHAFGPGRGLGGDLHFDDAENYVVGRGTNLQQVAVHEIGHSLGLGHSSDNNAIMAPFYQYRSNFQLGEDDIRGIQSLYGPPEDTATRPTLPTVAVTQPTTRATTPPRTLPPFSCNGRFDAAVQSFDGNIYFFQGGLVTKVNTQLRIVAGYPRAINAEFANAGIPDFVDAALLWELNAQNIYMYIFKGDQYWRIYNGFPSAGYPQNIANWRGLPDNLRGAFRWPGNRRIYFFTDNEYYRYNTMTYRIDVGYPRPLTQWPGVTPNITAVLDWSGQSYFFNDQYFQTFSTQTFQASANFQSARTWLGCQTEGLTEFNGTTEVMPTSGVELGVGLPSVYVLMLTAILGVFIHL